MPKLTQTGGAPKVEFVVSEPIDLVNAMYFTRLVVDADGIEGWPAQVRQEMDPALLAELDFLFTFPRGQPGVMGMLSETLFAHREAWADIDSLLRFVKEMPAGVGEPPLQPGVQGLALYGICPPFPGVEAETSAPPREGLVQAIEDRRDDVEATLAVYDRPEELRNRMLALIGRFYEEHYRHDVPRRLSCLERSVAAHRNEPWRDVSELARRLIGRGEECLEQDPSRYAELIFAPSVDMGPYVSCADMPPIHGLFYPCEPEFMGGPTERAGRTQRLARIYKALGDEQRLQIIQMLLDREMYAQEVVERTGLHQSVVSRHLTYMCAVGLLEKRREGKMKYFSPNPEVREELKKTLELFGGEQD